MTTDDDTSTAVFQFSWHKKRNFGQTPKECLIFIQQEKWNIDLCLCGSDPSHEQCAGSLRSSGWRTCGPRCVLWRKSWDQRAHTGSPSHWQWKEPGSLAALPLQVPVKEEKRNRPPSCLFSTEFKQSDVSCDCTFTMSISISKSVSSSWTSRLNTTSSAFCTENFLFGSGAAIMDPWPAPKSPLQATST